MWFNVRRHDVVVFIAEPDSFARISRQMIGEEFSQDEGDGAASSTRVSLKIKQERAAGLMSESKVPLLNLYHQKLILVRVLFCQNDFSHLQSNSWPIGQGRMLFIIPTEEIVREISH